MIRAARTVSVLMVIYLLATAATAYAEGAWVLWDNSDMMLITPGASKPGDLKSAQELGRDERRWKPERVHSTRGECRKDLERIAAAHAGLKGKIPKTDISVSDYSADNLGNWVHVNEVVWQDDGQVMVTVRHARCLPDTVDPRGAKR